MRTIVCLLAAFALVATAGPLLIADGRAAAEGPPPDSQWIAWSDNLTGDATPTPDPIAPAPAPNPVPAPRLNTVRHIANNTPGNICDPTNLARDEARRNLARRAAQSVPHGD